LNYHISIKVTSERYFALQLFLGSTRLFVQGGETQQFDAQ